MCALWTSPRPVSVQPNSIPFYIKNIQQVHFHSVPCDELSTKTARPDRYTYRVRIRRLFISNVVFRFRRLTAVKDKGNTLFPYSALNCASLFRMAVKKLSDHFYDRFSTRSTSAYSLVTLKDSVILWTISTSDASIPCMPCVTL